TERKTQPRISDIDIDIEQSAGKYCVGCRTRQKTPDSKKSQRDAPPHLLSLCAFGGARRARRCYLSRKRVRICLPAVWQKASGAHKRAISSAAGRIVDGSTNSGYTRRWSSSSRGSAKFSYMRRAGTTDGNRLREHHRTDRRSRCAACPVPSAAKA